MQTKFTEEQLRDPDNFANEKVFKKCVHCGMCNATCPTHQLLGDELDGPRGRIYLIKDMLENNRKPTEKVVKHIDRCLSCYSCMTTCPAGVNYMHIIDHGKKYIEKNYQRSLFDKLIRYFLSITLPNTKVFRLSSLLVKLSKPFKFLMPSKIKDMIELMPTKFPKKSLPIKEVYKSSTKKRIARVALLTGCVQKEISPQINEATIRLLNRHGVEVVVPKKIRCCGSLNHHLGKEEDAHQDFKNNINTWYEEHQKGNLDAILSNTSGCGTTMKDYGFIFREDKELSKKSTSEWLKIFAGNVPAAPILDVKSSLQNEFVKERNNIQTITTKNKKNISLLKTPIRFDTENHVDKTAPELGEHNEEIFTKLGYSIEDINLLKNKDII